MVALTKVLIVEDSVEVAEAYRHLLARATNGEVAVVWARTAADALALARAELPDALLLDDCLPDEHRLDVLTRLRSDPATSALPVVLLSRPDLAARQDSDVQRGSGDDGAGDLEAAASERLRRAIADAVDRQRLLENERAARAVAEAAQERQAFLAEVGAALAGSLDFEQTLKTVARLPLPRLADFSIVDLIEGGGVRRVAGAHVDPALLLLVEQLCSHAPDPASPGRVAATTWTETLGIIPEMTDAFLVALAHNAQHFELIRSLRPQSAMVVPLVVRGQTIGVLTLGLTTSDRRYDAADLALAQEVARRCAVALDNARLFEQTRRAVLVRDEFLGTVTHDLKNPLTAIKGNTQMLQIRLSRLNLPDADRILAGLEAINTSCMKMVAMLDELLDVTRLRIGEPLTLRFRPTDLVAVAKECIGEYRQTTAYQRVRLETAVPEIVGHWDAERLARVIGNLLDNAIKYSPRGGAVTVTLKVESNGSPRWAVVKVRDEGIGIPAADLPHIFDRFHRGGNVAGQIAGSGIGLAGARQIVEQHGGMIAASSQEGVGTTITVRLPLASASLNDEEPRAEPTDVAR